MNEKTQEMDRLVDRVVRHQADLGKSDSAFVATYQEYIGSGKNWTHRLKVKQYGELNLDKWLGKLRLMVRMLEGVTEGVEVVEELPITQYALLMYHQLMGTHTDRRIGWLIGDYGTGKTIALEHLRQKYRGSTCCIEAHEYWRENKALIIREIAKGLGIGDANSPGEVFNRVVEHLRSQVIVILIDEGHHGGVMLLKLLKSLVNMTRARFIVGTYGTALRRLEQSSTSAIEEARQVLGRSIRPISYQWDKGVGYRDVEAFLIHVAGLTRPVGALARRIAPLIAGDGNLRQLADAITAAEIDAGKRDADMTDDDLIEAIEALPSKPADPSKVRKGVAA